MMVFMRCSTDSINLETLCLWKLLDLFREKRWGFTSSEPRLFVVIVVIVVVVFVVVFVVVVLGVAMEVFLFVLFVVVDDDDDVDNMLLVEVFVLLFV